MTPELTDEVRAAARIVAQQWPGVIDADDAEQEIWVRILESDYVDRLSEMDAPARASVLRKIGSRAASEERDDFEVFSGNVFYGTKDVRRLLASGLLDKPHKKIDVNSETLTGWLDLHEGCQALRDENPDYADAIGSKFLLGDPVGSADRKRLQRAVDRLTIHMNRVHTRRFAVHHDGPGSRQAVSNARARAITHLENA